MGKMAADSKQDQVHWRHHHNRQQHNYLRDGRRRVAVCHRGSGVYVDGSHRQCEVGSVGGFLWRRCFRGRGNNKPP